MSAMYKILPPPPKLNVMEIKNHVLTLTAAHRAETSASAVCTEAAGEGEKHSILIVEPCNQVQLDHFVLSTSLGRPWAKLWSPVALFNLWM